MASRYELTAVYLGLQSPKTCWTNEDGSQTIIARVEDSTTSEPVTIKGVIFPNQLVRGMCYTFFGEMKTHDKFGDQFAFSSFVAAVPAGEESVTAYLCQCRGIGPALARSIFAIYGDESVETLRVHPEKAASVVPRLTLEKANEASLLLKKWHHVEKVKLSLLGLLKGRGFPKRLVDHLIEDHGANAADMVKRNPYLLMKYKNVGFDKCDRMYCQLGLNPNRMKRQALCAWYGVTSQRGGNTWEEFYVVKNILRERIGSAEVNEDRAMELAVRGGLLSEAWDRGQRYVAERGKCDVEDRLAELIDEARQEADVVPPAWLNLPQEMLLETGWISEHQSEESCLFTKGYVGIFSGLPGTGKTYTAARLIKYLADAYGEHQIVVCALAGKAAVKITSELEKLNVGIRATTIHSMLGFGPCGGWNYGRGNPLPHRFIIVDESSMPACDLFLPILEARDEYAHVLFSGDENQLAPIGYGAPFRDMIRAGVPRGHLTEIKRQGNISRITRACHEIVKCGKFAPSPKLDPANGEDFAFLEKETVEEQLDTLAAIIEHQQKKYDAGDEGAIDPIWDMQIIVPINGKSELGRRPLNLKLQKLFNPDGRRANGNPFRVGDKIVCRTSGDYALVQNTQERESDTDPFDGPEPEKKIARVCNGEMAEVLDVTPTTVVARLTSPDRTVVIRRAATEERDDAGGSDDSGTDGDDGDAKEKTNTGCDFELGYACSGHAYQGCEVHTGIVIIDSHSSAKMVSSKQWIFTGFSRAKNLLLAIGQMKVALDMCKRDQLSKRKTLLAEKIVALRKRIKMNDSVREMLLEGVGA